MGNEMNSRRWMVVHNWTGNILYVAAVDIKESILSIPKDYYE